MIQLLNWRDEDSWPACGLAYHSGASRLYADYSSVGPGPRSPGTTQAAYGAATWSMNGGQKHGSPKYFGVEASDTRKKHVEYQSSNDDRPNEAAGRGNDRHVLDQSAVITARPDSLCPFLSSEKDAKDGSKFTSEDTSVSYHPTRRSVLFSYCYARNGTNLPRSSNLTGDIRLKHCMNYTPLLDDGSSPAGSLEAEPPSRPRRGVNPLALADAANCAVIFSSPAPMRHARALRYGWEGVLALALAIAPHFLGPGLSPETCLCPAYLRTRKYGPLLSAALNFPLCRGRIIIACMTRRPPRAKPQHHGSEAGTPLLRWAQHHGNSETNKWHSHAGQASQDVGSETTADK
ncbi:hypothetical protein SODALDRAFT_359106 [Sodiomyces alkalinus F11]|uniref:Uncharacterized protein n=1 Tax=Sodiomyces alkalinus (strain CBS 110278 / VKM F-3762 / F11) TaxID=1314773 RepID=A0A3N2PXH1_SODAK|nr:hypothetical protein SODALDRAFT_359106 [Sodiomyces alkalinus F11]ROT39233.1 hypothetical protein SODALDRAFT_359106 [Sodiomyces alkalinus F11]